MGNTNFKIPSFTRHRDVARKRKSCCTDLHSEYDDEYINRESKRRRKTSTSKYIYKTLFEEGCGSDVTITALNTQWRLHKIYLCQSPYFSSMFSGAWREAQNNDIFIGIEDSNITVKALKASFGSLYQDEIQILPSEAVSIIAAAILFQLDDLIVQCTEVMKDCVNSTTVLPFYEAAQRYGLTQIENVVFGWLLKNTVTKLAECPSYLKQISCDLMLKLVSSSHLVVIQTEFTLYVLLKTWLFLKENMMWEGDISECFRASNNYFSDHKGDTAYLLSESCKDYIAVFRALRLKHLVNHYVDLEIIETDCIIPASWFMPIFKMQWSMMLRVDQGMDRGPRFLSDEEFQKQCSRCGRVLLKEMPHQWRWTGFNFGLDIVVYYHSRTFQLQRCLRANSDNPLIPEPPRHLMYSICVYSGNENGNGSHVAETKVKTVTFEGNDPVTALVVNDMSFPLIVSANFLLTTPLRTTDTSRPMVENPAPLPVIEYE